MKFLAIYTPDPKNAGTPPSDQHQADMGRLIEEGFKAGTLVATGALSPGLKCAQLRRSGGEITSVDGPFAETKELIVGFALLELDSKQEAIASCRRFLEVAGDGDNELYEVFEPKQ